MELHVSPKRLPKKKLNNLDILRAILFEKERYKHKANSKKEAGIFVLANIVATKIEENYRELGIENIRKDKLKRDVCNVYKFRQKMMKSPRPRRHNEEFTNKMKLYGRFMSKSLSVSCKSVAQVPRKRKTTPKKHLDIVHADAEINDTDEFSEVDDENDLNFEPILTKSSAASSNKKRNLSEIVEAKSRYGVSYRCTSAIVNATLRTYNIPEIIDKSRLVRAEKRKFSELEQDTVSFGGGVYYDGRKDLSIMQKKKKVENGKFKFYRTIEREEHISMISQPEGLFLGYVPVKNSTSKSSSNAIISLLQQQNKLDDLIALGGDGTNTNVGADGGINRFIEIEVDRPLHWFICMLHLNELPLKRLIIKLDGETSGRKNFKRFHAAKKLPKMPDLKKLSNDQKYLYNIVNALMSGKFPESLKQMKVGELNHSRWLTTASRICKLYALTKKPSATLIALTSYIVNVYAPTWFYIKKHELAVNGPKNLYFLIKSSDSIIDGNVKLIVQKRIQRNVFFAHSENILLAQLASQKNQRELMRFVKY